MSLRTWEQKLTGHHLLLCTVTASQLPLPTSLGGKQDTELKYPRSHNLAQVPNFTANLKLETSMGNFFSLTRTAGLKIPGFNSISCRPTPCHHRSTALSGDHLVLNPTLSNQLQWKQAVVGTKVLLFNFLPS
jgi:hypothetical protein